MAFSYRCGKTLREVSDWFGIPDDMRERIWGELSAEGYTEKGICYAASRAEEKLYRFQKDSRFESIFKNEVRKYALKPGDPRWQTRKEEYRKMKLEEWKLSKS